MGDDRLTEFEFFVVAGILHAGDDAYGVRIAEEIEVRTGREVSVGTLYRALRRLEARGLVASELGEATPERGGRAKTFYRVEGAGMEAFRSVTRDLGAVLDGLSLDWRPT